MSNNKFGNHQINLTEKEPEMVREKPDSKIAKPLVLIVDDDEDFAITLQEILITKGYEACLASQARQALEMTKNELCQFDIALIDLNLPDLSGLDLISRLRLATPKTEIIVVTGYPSLPTAIKALNLGAFGYIEKPYSVDRLFLLLERALERKNLLARLEEAETQNQTLFDELGVATALVCLKTKRISRPNQAFVRLFGYSATDLTDRSLTLGDLFEGEKVAELESALNRLVESKAVVLETKLKRRANANFWAEIHLSLLKSLPGTALALILDLTKRKEAETLILKTKAYLEAIFSGVASGVAIIDLSYTIVDANPAFAAAAQGRDAVLGKKCYEVLHNHKVPCANFGEVCPIQHCLVTQTKSRVYHERSGRYYEVTVTPLKDEKGNLSSFIYVQNDLTEIKKARDALELKSKELLGLNSLLATERERLIALTSELEKANSELVKLSRAKSEFVQAVSHELRTPLTAIMEGVSLLLDRALGSINQDQNRFLVLIRNNAKRLADLINDLLDLSKIEAGRYELNPVKLNLEKIIKELVLNLGELVKEKGLTLNLGTDFSQLPPVLADERSVFRVLMNLLSNAIKFTPAGGQITISGTTENGVLVVTVADTGIGIPKDQQYKLFKKFSQIIPAGETRPQGTGLGLALSKELIELNQGKIWVESEEGKGSRFMFSLPIYKEREDLEQTWDRLSCSSSQAGVPITVYLFKAEAEEETDGGQALETIERIIKSQVTRFEIIKPFFSFGAVMVFNFTGHDLADLGSKTQFAKLCDYLRGTTFLSGLKEIKVKVLGSYYIKAPTEGLTFDQLLERLLAGLKEII